MSRKHIASEALLKNIQVPQGDKTYEKILDAGLALFVEFGLSLIHISEPTRHA